MNLSDFSIQPKKKQSIEYYIHLVRIAKADDLVSDNELELLHRIGERLGFSDLEIDELIASTDRMDYIHPYELSARFEQVFEIVKMTLADGVIDRNEMRLASSFAVKSGFSDDEIPGLLLLLIDGIRKGKNEEELFSIFKAGLRLRP
jgi:hypothetical protein